MFWDEEGMVTMGAVRDGAGKTGGDRDGIGRAGKQQALVVKVAAPS